MPYKTLEDRNQHRRSKRKLFLSKYVKKCYQCGCEFTPQKRIDQKYCSHKCANDQENLIKKNKISVWKLNQREYKIRLEWLNIKYQLNSTFTKLRVRDKHYRSKYGISIFDYYNICEHQDWLCPICNESLHINSVTDGRSNPIDHCHETGKVRGITHSICNTNLGIIEPLLKLTFEGFCNISEYVNQHKQLNQL